MLELIQPSIPAPGMTPKNKLAAFLLALSPLTAPTVALAHPHVFVTARAEIVFDESGAITSIRHIWQFDEAFSAFAVQGLDADGDNALTRAELAPLAQINVESLEVYGFFTWLYARDREIALLPPDEYWLDIYDARLTLFYTLPLEASLAETQDVVLEVTDPEFFVAFEFAEEQPVQLVGAPATCAAFHRGPAELDEEDALLLATIPADQQLPPELAALTAGQANAINIDC